MAEPPSYEESASEYGQTFNDQKVDEKPPQRFSIREEVGASRSQHVAALVSKLLPQIRSRAKNGLSKSTLLLLPSDQECTRKGQLVGFNDEDTPIIIQLEGRYDSLEFWLQTEAIEDLQSQMYVSISDTMPSSSPKEVPLPQRPIPQPAKSSWFGRKQGKAPSVVGPAQTSTKPPVSVGVELEEVHFRAETEYGLYETLRGNAVVVVVEVK